MIMLCNVLPFESFSEKCTQCSFLWHLLSWWECESSIEWLESFERSHSTIRRSNALQLESSHSMSKNEYKPIYTNKMMTCIQHDCNERPIPLYTRPSPNLFIHFPKKFPSPPSIHPSIRPTYCGSNHLVFNQLNKRAPHATHTFTY